MDPLVILLIVIFAVVFITATALAAPAPKGTASGEAARGVVHVTEGDQRAVRVARCGCTGMIPVPDDCEVVVSRIGGAYVVTFGCGLPPGLTRSDYYARVTVDAHTWKPVKVVGSF